MRWNVGTKLTTGFGLTLLILAIVGLSSYQATRELISAAEIREHTYNVLAKLGDTLSSVKDLQTAQRGFIITGEESYLAPYHQALPRLKATIAELRSLTKDNASQQSRLDRLDVLIRERLDITEHAIDTRRTSGIEAAIQEVRTRNGEANMDQIRNLLGEMQGDEENLLRDRNDKAEAGAERAIWTIIGGTLAAFAIGGFTAVLLTRNIAWPLRTLTDTAERIALGDLNVNVAATDRADEVGSLTKAFERMTGSLRGLAGAADRIAVGELRTPVKPLSAHDQLGNAFTTMIENLREQIRGLADAAGVLGASASEIVASTSQLASSASESAAAVSETTTTVEEVRQTAQVASQKAKSVSDAAQKAAATCNAGRKSAEDAIEGMTRIRQQMGAIAETMVRLSEQGQAIGQIIATVEDLSSQSNLLAVNAAIEAAKAGEHGKGFSVVAQEVKSLAEQSRQATSQIRTILGDIQKATAAAVMATEQGNRAVEAGEKQSEATADSIGALSGSVSESAQAATQIAASSQQQLIGMDQVALAMENIKQASAQNVASAKQLETAARGLNDLGTRLKQMVERYKV